MHSIYFHFEIRKKKEFLINNDKKKVFLEKWNFLSLHLKRTSTVKKKKKNVYSEFYFNRLLSSKKSRKFCSLTRDSRQVKYRNNRKSGVFNYQKKTARSIPRREQDKRARNSLCRVQKHWLQSGSGRASIRLKRGTITFFFFFFPPPIHVNPYQRASLKQPSESVTA